VKGYPEKQLGLFFFSNANLPLLYWLCLPIHLRYIPKSLEVDEATKNTRSEWDIVWRYFSINLLLYAIRQMDKKSHVLDPSSFYWSQIFGA